MVFWTKDTRPRNWTRRWELRWIYYAARLHSTLERKYLDCREIGICVRELVPTQSRYSYKTKEKRDATKKRERRNDSRPKATDRVAELPTATHVHVHVRTKITFTGRATEDAADAQHCMLRTQGRQAEAMYFQNWTNCPRIPEQLFSIEKPYNEASRSLKKFIR